MQRIVNQSGSPVACSSARAGAYVASASQISTRTTNDADASGRTAAEDRSSRYW